MYTHNIFMNKNNLKLSFLLIFFLGLVFYTKTQLVDFKKLDKSPEIQISTLSIFGKLKSKAIAASCGFTLHGSADEYTTCNNITCPDGSTVSAPGTSQCGGACQPTPQPQINATCIRTNCANPTVMCNRGRCVQFGCPSDYNLIYGTFCEKKSPCENFCTAGITPTVSYINNSFMYNGLYIYLNNTNPTPSYSLGSCSSATPPGNERRCEITRTTSDGSQTSSWTENYDIQHTTWPNQPNKTYPYSENISIRCGYWNTTTNSYSSQSAAVTANALVAHPKYGQPCTNTDSCGIVSNGTYDIYGICNAAVTTPPSCSFTNICGQSFSGFQCASGCTATNGSTDINSSCIQDFKVTTDKVNPNGSTEFSWTITPVAGIGSKCGFVDLTTATPRVIPGLQNLDPSTDKVRISNIQTTTRFCLVCEFYNLVNNVTRGTAQAHQWIRVIRVGED